MRDWSPHAKTSRLSARVDRHSRNGESRAGISDHRMRISRATAPPRMPAPDAQTGTGARLLPAAASRAGSGRLSFRSLGLTHLWRPLGIPPPHGWKCRTCIRWQRLRMRKAIPARGADFVSRELRHDVVIPNQHRVESPGRRAKLFAVLGKDQLLDERIDGGIFDADVIAGPVDVGPR